MRVEIIDFSDIDSIVPGIEGDDVFSITVTFTDGTTMVYGYTDRDGFRYDYKYLMDAWSKFGRIK